MKKVVIIGSGFSSIAAACYLAKAGFKVSVYEKNTHIGGRAQVFHKDGFTFDMGPTWYWMPDVFERFFADFDMTSSAYYDLVRLDPAYRVYFGQNDFVDISGLKEEIIETFEKIEPNSGEKLEKYLSKASDNYDIAIKDLVYKPGLSPFELVSFKTATRLHLFFSSISDIVKRQFSNDKLRQILQFPVLFLGAKPNATPAFYNFMNYADFGLGTWYPKGGMSKVIEGMVALAKSLGVEFFTDSEVSQIIVENKNAVGVTIHDRTVACDLVLSGADYHHTETLLPPDKRMYSETYWDKKVFAPSSLLFFIGFDKTLDYVQHHTLFFDTDFDLHSQEIYDTKQWPKNPLFYGYDFKSFGVFNRSTSKGTYKVCKILCSQ